MQALPVIVMTSSNAPRDMEECQKLKVASYVEKPITLASFSKAVANIFHQSTAPISLTRAGHCH
jgi:CheY-like chemotaxis protein